MAKKAKAAAKSRSAPKKPAKKAPKKPVKKAVRAAKKAPKNPVKKAAKKAAKPAPRKSAAKRPAPKPAPKKAASKAVAKKVVRRKAPPKPQKGKAAPKPPATKVAESRSRSTTAAALAGLTVIEIGGGVEAAAAGSILANFGARVIKIESSRGGDPERTAEPLVGDTGAAFLMLNRGKQSVALEATSPKAKSAYLALAASADIVIDGAGYGVLDRAGVGYKALSKQNERLVYVAITGFGQSGPNVTEVGSEINYLAFAGALELFGGASNLPALPGISISPIAAGALPAVVGALTALHVREATGQGQLVDAAIVDGLMGVMGLNLADYSASKLRPRYGKGRFYGQYACYQLYPARGSHWLAVGALDGGAWGRLCKLLKREDLISDQYADEDRQQVLIAELTRIFQRKDIRDWMELFAGQDVCVTPVHGVAGAVHDPHLLERGTVLSLKGADGPFSQLGVYPKLSETPGAVGGDPPQVGQHTREALEQAGLAKKAIDALIKSKVAAVPR